MKREEKETQKMEEVDSYNHEEKEECYVEMNIALGVLEEKKKAFSMEEDDDEDNEEKNMIEELN